MATATRTIQSPGVEIREFDRSDRIPTPAGTTVYVTGFADQGPTDEAISISSLSEFNSIYGPPKNAAERYFFHTVKGLFGSTANVLVNRLPYGSGSGVGFGSYYSALVYPTQLFNPSIYDAGETQVTQINLGGSYNENTLSATAFTVQTDDGKLHAYYWDNNGSVSSSVQTLTSNTYNVNQFGVHPLNLTDFTLSGMAISILTDLSSRVSTVGSVTGSGIITTTLSSVGTVTYAASATLPATVSVTTTGRDANNGVTSNLNAVSGTYFLGKPKQFTLTENEYLQLIDGAGFTWSSTASSVSEITSLADVGHAGLIVLNKAQTTIDQKYQGYYIGLVDNVDADNIGSDFNKIRTVYTLSQSGTGVTNYTTVPTGNLTFSLTSTADQRVGSISEQLETSSRGYIIGNDNNFDDTLNINIFKLRQSVFENDPKLLIYNVQEQYTGSLTDAQRQFASPNGGQPVTYYLGNKINTESSNISILVNPYLNNTAFDSAGKGSSYDTNSSVITKKKVRMINNNMVANYSTLSSYVGFDMPQASLTTLASNLNYVDALFPLGTFSDEGFTDKTIGFVPAKVGRALDKVRNDELFNIDIVVEAGLGTVHAWTAIANTDDPIITNYDDTAYNEAFQTALSAMQKTEAVATSDLRDNYMAVYSKFADFATTFQKGGRGDVFFIADPIRHIFVQGANTKVIELKTTSFSQHIYWALRNQYAYVDSSYTAVYSNWLKVADDYSGKFAWVPSSGYTAALMATTDSLLGPWNAPAGFNRGQITGIVDIAFSPNQRQRDDLYKIAFNPIAGFPGQGIVVFGQKTMQKKPSAFDRINVRRLFLYMEKAVKVTSKYFVFEPNTKYTRDRFKGVLDPFFERIKNADGLYEYLIVCDERNNSPQVIDNNELVVDIYLKPVRTAEFILVNFYATRTDTKFEELIGRA